MVDIVEVAPRDGLQDEPVHLSTADKVELIGRLAHAGLRRIEAVSFAHPRVVPQMADAEAVMAALPRSDEVSYIGLVLNEKGLERAVAAGVDEINFVIVASDTFSQRNQNYPTKDGVALWHRIAAAAGASELRTTVTVSAAFGCPYEGEIETARVAWILEELAASPPDEVALTDTIGAAVPTDVTERLGLVSQTLPNVRTRLHVHNTRNTGIANAYAAVEADVSAIDASTGGIGGCPFAPAATGNIPTEDLVYMLARMGIDVGVDLESLLDTVGWLGDLLGSRPPGMLGRAGPFPMVRADS